LRLKAQIKAGKFQVLQFCVLLLIVIVHAFADGLQHRLLNHLFIHASPLVLLLLALLA
jgi:hypothetical protein